MVRARCSQGEAEATLIMRAPNAAQDCWQNSDITGKLVHRENLSLVGWIYPAVDYQCTCAGGVQLRLKIWPYCLSNNTSGPLSQPTVSSPHPSQQAPVALCILQCPRYGAVLCLQRREEIATHIQQPEAHAQRCQAAEES